MLQRELLDIAEDWFKTQDWKPHSFQRKSWLAYLENKNGLLNAPTGSGKTYALWFPIVLEILKEKQKSTSKNNRGLKAIWITPLRALSKEIKQSAERIVQDLNLSLTIGIRTGDTSSKERAQQKKHMPNLLITTPESMHLLLASKNYQSIFKNCNAIVVDEWHELMGTKRGVQTELALSRLKSISSKLKIWGISATIGNLEQAREVLLGPTDRGLS